MKIIANVDESDIGQIKEGQKVTFTVQAYSDKTFNGVVTQIRIKSTTSSNVVNYPIVILANNADKLLLPGMTATIDFYVDQRENVLLVPNTALKFDAPEELTKEIKTEMEKGSPIMAGGNGPGNAPGQGMPAGPPPNGKPGEGNGPGNAKMSMSKVYYQDANGKIKMGMIQTGLTDGKNTEIINSRELSIGSKVVTGIVETTTATTKKSSNALNPSSNQGGPPPPPMM